MKHPMSNNKPSQFLTYRKEALKSVLNWLIPIIAATTLVAFIIGSPTTGLISGILICAWLIFIRLIVIDISYLLSLLFFFGFMLILLPINQFLHHTSGTARWWYAILPLVAVFLAGRKIGATITIICGLLAFSMDIAIDSLWAPFNGDREGLGKQEFIEAAIHCVAIFMIGIIAYIFELSREKALSEADTYYRSQAKLIDELNRANKTVKETLKQKEQIKANLNETTKIAKIGGWSYDITTGTCWLSEEAYRICKLPTVTLDDLDQLLIIFDDDAKNNLREAINLAIKQGKDWDLILPFMDGNKKNWMRSCGLYEVKDDGKPELRGFFQNVTTAFEHELGLQRAKENAINLAQERTNFLTNMSHEIRTPMNAVLGFAELLKEERLTEKQSGYIKTILNAGNHMLHILNEILDYAKIDAKKLTLKKQNFNLIEMTNELYELYENSAKQNRCKLIKQLPLAKELRVSSDEYRIKQILSNLLGNAVKFTNSGDIELKLSLVGESTKDLWIKFIVSDSGVGIAKEDVEKIFTPFEQADSSSTRVFGGTGLGLSISCRLVELLGSKLECESQIGTGSTFSFVLRMEKSKITEEKYEDRQISALNLDLKILVVEDTSFNQELMGLMLTDIGFFADFAENGRQAIDMVSKQNNDLIFMDCQMPIMDGFEATKKIRSLALKQQPYITAMTANALSEDKVACIAAGMDAHLSKPILKKDLHRFLVKISEFKFKNVS